MLRRVWFWFFSLGKEAEKQQKMIGVGFEPTPPKRPVPETGALDRSAIQPIFATIILDTPITNSLSMFLIRKKLTPPLCFGFASLSSPRGLMDKALVSGAKDCGFESRRG